MKTNSIGRTVGQRNTFGKKSIGSRWCVECNSKVTSHCDHISMSARGRRRLAEKERRADRAGGAS